MRINPVRLSYLFSIFSFSIPAVAQQFDQPQGSQVTGYNPLEYREFWNPPEQTNQLAQAVAKAQKVHQVQGILFTALRANPLQPEQVGSAAIKGAQTAEKIGIVIQTLFEFVEQKTPEKQIEIAKSCLQATPKELKPLTARFAAQRLSETDQTLLAAEILANVPAEALLPSLQEIGPILQADRLNQAVALVWPTLAEDRRLLIQQALQQAFIVED